MFKFQRRTNLSHLKNNTKGSFTLEASLVFPIIFILTIAVILFSLTIYEKVVVYQKAHKIAERVAFTWDNSKKDFDTGDFAMNEYTTLDDMDGLYWRSNQIATALIEKAFGKEMKSVQNEKKNRAEEEAKRIFYSTKDVDGQDVDVTVNSGYFSGEVIVTAESRLKLPKFVNAFTDGKFKASATASIKDPVELIRITDLAHFYGAQILKSLFE